MCLEFCFLARMLLTGWVFQDKVRIDECQTHDFNKLMDLAGLRAELVHQSAVNSAAGGAFKSNWNVVNTWQVDSRYSLAGTEQEAKELFAAITDQPDGVLAWITSYW